MDFYEYYFQSYSQSNIGWKIHVVDAGHKWKDEKDDAVRPNSIINSNLPLTCIFVLVQMFTLNLL